jgi:hypothetical protein
MMPEIVTIWFLVVTVAGVPFSGLSWYDTFHECVVAAKAIAPHVTDTRCVPQPRAKK